MAWNNIKTHQFHGYGTNAQGLLVKNSSKADNACEVISAGATAPMCIGVVKEENLKDGDPCGIAREGLVMCVADGPINNGDYVKPSTTVDGYVTKTTDKTEAIGYAGQSVTNKDYKLEVYLTL